MTKTSRRLTPLAATAVCAVIGSAQAAGAAASSPTAAADADSAIGAAFVREIVVSPAYARTGTVVVLATQINCQRNCFPTWISHDGGATWHASPTTAYQPVSLAIAIDANGHETFFGGGARSLMRSDDGGDHWTPVGTGGRPTVLPTYAHDRRVVVAESAGPADYLSHDAVADDVIGSAGNEQDMQFMLSPTYPSGGAYSPVLLVALDAASRRPELLECTAQFECSHPRPFAASVVANGTGGTLLYPAGDYPERGVVFANTNTEVYKSTDGGHSFAPLTVAPTAGALAATIPMFSLAPGYREAGPVRTAYAAISLDTPQENGIVVASGGIYRTLDGGATWTPLATKGVFAGGATAIAAAPNGRLFAGFYTGTSSAGLTCSVDGGTSWRPTCPPLAGTQPNPASVRGVSAATGGATSVPRSSLQGIVAAVLIATLAYLGWVRRHKRRSAQ